MIMLNELIQNAAKLMHEQAVAYARLDAACQHLCTALINGQPEQIERLTRGGEAELLNMRARLVQLMAALSAFAEEPAGAAALDHDTRVAFRDASNELLEAAQSYQRARARAATLAHNGAAFAASGIENCGVPPTTYRAPYSRSGGATRWA